MIKNDNSQTSPITHNIHTLDIYTKHVTKNKNVHKTKQEIVLIREYN